jgi:hypothetical protein
MTPRGIGFGAILHKTLAFRLALAGLCAILTLAAVNLSMTGAARAQQCAPGNVLCEDGCYAMGAQCCQGVVGVCAGGGMCRVR